MFLRHYYDLVVELYLYYTLSVQIKFVYCYICLLPCVTPAMSETKERKHVDKVAHNSDFDTDDTDEEAQNKKQKRGDDRYAMTEDELFAINLFITGGEPGCPCHECKEFRKRFQK